MANYTMHHLVVGNNTYEMVDEQGRANIAPSFSTSTTYASGEYVIYSGKLYQFTASHSGAWTGADAVECTVTEKLGGGSGDGLTEDIKAALLQITQKVAYVDEDGQDYYDALYDALYPPVDLDSISAVYTQSGTVYDTDTLDSLKPDLVVTAHYSDQTSETVTTYTLSGTLTAGTSTITVSHGGKTATFDVTVTMSRETRFGTFVNGHSVSKAVSATTDIALNGIWVSSANARAAFSVPIVNNGYVITVTDSSKYNVAVYDVTDNTPIPTTNTNAIEHVYYAGGTKSISWKTSDSATTPYILISLKKMNNSAFTAEELANGAEAVFTYTES